MRRFLKLLVIASMGAAGLAGFTARADLEVSAAFSIHSPADFYAPLEANGTWTDVGNLWALLAPDRRGGRVASL